MIEICKMNTCIGCGACMSVCPRECIVYCEDRMGNIYPAIDEEKCIDCNSCKKVCPNNFAVEKNNPMICYAAWSNDPDERLTSASGGIAAEFYKYMVEHTEGVAAGVCLDDDLCAKYKVTNNVDDLKQFKNSKYVFSYMNDTYQDMLEILKQDKKALFIGLPCQNAALINFLKMHHVNRNNVLTVDLICHGVAASKYLQEHIRNIEMKTKKIVKEILFRDPDFHTENFIFSLRSNTGEKFYKKGVYQDDVYSLAYHKALSYRENCYQCRYACAERCSDITIGDFSGLGKIEDCPFENRNVSCLLVNTEKGRKYVEALLRDERITAHERLLEEALGFEKQLKKSSSKHRRRGVFEAAYIQTRDFEKAAKTALRFELIWNKLNVFLPLRSMKTLALKLAHSNDTDK